MVHTFLAALVVLRPPVADLPFESIGNRIYLQATVNGKPITAILDTGAGTSVVDLELAKSLGAETTQTLRLGGAGAETQTGYFLKKFEVSLNDSSLKHDIRIAMSLSSLGPLEGRPLQAVIGYDFLRNYTVEVDYAAKRVKLFESGAYTPPPNVAALPMSIVMGHPRIDGTVDVPSLGSIAVHALVDTGASSALSFTTKFVNKQKLIEKFPDLPSLPTGAGVGGKVTGKRLRITGAEFGGAKVNAPVASLTESGGGVLGENASFDVLIGGELLKRFTVTFDYPGRQMYFQPNANLNKPFVGDRTGLFLRAEGKDYNVFKVFGLTPKGPALEAGVKEGDVILEIDGRAATGFTLESLRTHFRETTNTVTLKLQRGAETLSVSFVPREMV